MSIDRSRLERFHERMISRRDMLARCSTGFGLVALSGLVAGGKSLAAPAGLEKLSPFAPRPPPPDMPQ